MLTSKTLKILDIGCGNYSPTTTKQWFKNCHYAGVDIAHYNLSPGDVEAMDEFFLVNTDGSGYDAIPDRNYDFIIMNHVVEHMTNPSLIVALICSKLAPGGIIWIAFPSVKSLSLPSAEGTLQFCDDATHIYLPDVREISNVLMANGVRVHHAGRSRNSIRWMIGLVVYPFAFLRKAMVGRLSSKGLWYFMGFEDHVLGRLEVR